MFGGTNEVTGMHKKLKNREVTKPVVSDAL